MQYIIGVDAGGTKTEAIAYSLEGEVLAKGYSDFGNLLMGFETAVKNIVAGVAECIRGIHGKGLSGECLGIYLGIAGSEVKNYAETLENLLRKEFLCQVRCLHDSELAHAAILKGEDGIMTISGTGSVSYGVYQGKHARTGGWGHLLGDEGSGYSIALSAFKRMTTEEDSGAAKSELTLEILKKLGLSKTNDVKEFIYSASKTDIAAFAPLVAELAESSEINATQILKQAGKELALMTARLQKILGINESFKIGISGSILLQVDLVREEFESCLEEEAGVFQLVAEDISPTWGAVYLNRKTKNLDK